MVKHKIFRFTLAALIAVLFLTTAVNAQSAGETEVNIYFFWGDGCPHCEDEKEFLAGLVNRELNINVVDYEVWYDKDNQKVLMEFGQALSFEPVAVPVTVIGERYWIGFTEALGQEMEAAAKALLEDPNHTDIGKQINGSPSEPAPTGDPSRTIKLPIFGSVNLEQQSLAISTAIIGFVDGFNPCSLWVLSVLLAMTLHSGSRKKILVVGITFLVVTTIIYSLFISGVFTLFSYIGYLKWIQLLVALVALVFGMVNIKDYFWYKQGISFTISDKKKPKLYENMRSTVTDTRSMLGLIGSSAALAVGVSFVEFSCTAGFPVIWSNLVATANVSLGTYLLLLGLYMLIYLLDELAVFGAIAVTMRASRMEEKHGRLLKLASGVIMATLGVVMAVNPELMNNVSSSLLVFLFALALTLVISVTHRRLLPALGIQIGDEGKKKKSRKRH
jgi:glutaredoxin